MSIDIHEHLPASSAASSGASASSTIVFLMDAGGVRPTMHAMAQRLADLGHRVLMPNLYWRHGAYAPFDARTVFSVPDERARLMAMVQSVTPANAMDDVAACLADVDAKERVGVVGYCMGGTVAFRAAAAFPERVRACAGIHAGGLVNDKPDSPHLGAPRIQARVYLGCADDDRSCTAEHRATLARALGDARVEHEIELYEGKRHGFAVPDFAVFDVDAAERHWAKLAALFAR